MKKIKFLSVYYFACAYVLALKKQIKLREEDMILHIKPVIMQVKLMRIPMHYM